MPDEIIKADEAARRIVLIIIAAAAGVTALLVVKLLPLFQGYLRALPPAEAAAVLKMVLMALFLSVTPGGLYIFHLGRRIYRDGRFPPIGMKVIKDTRLITGPPARLRGRVLMLISAFMIALGLLGAGYAYFALNALLGW